MCVAVCFPHPCHKVQFVQQEKHDVDELGRNKVSMIIYSCLYMLPLAFLKDSEFFNSPTHINFLY